MQQIKTVLIFIILQLQESIAFLQVQFPRPLNERNSMMPKLHQDLSAEESF